MLEVDGSLKSGSGTILRLSMMVSAITCQPLHISNIRQRRPQPGLRPQHLETVQTVAKLCNAELEGASLGSKELYFTPKEIVGGDVEAEIQTAGSIPMLFLATLPICLYSKDYVHLHVSKGGTDVSHSPTINYLRYVLLPVLKRMGVEAEISVQKFGYYPKGLGEATMTVMSNRNLTPIMLADFGELKSINGVSVCTFLADKQVAERQAKTAQDVLAQRGFKADIAVINDESNTLQKGSSIALWAETTTGAIIGADAIGELGKTSEAVGKKAAYKLIGEVSYSPTVDVYLADMLVPFISLAKGTSVFYTTTLTEHLETNLFLMAKLSNAKFTIQKIEGRYRIEKYS